MDHLAKVDDTSGATLKGAMNSTEDRTTMGKTLGQIAQRYGITVRSARMMRLHREGMTDDARSVLVNDARRVQEKKAQGKASNG